MNFTDLGAQILGSLIAIFITRWLCRREIRKREEHLILSLEAIETIRRDLEHGQTRTATDNLHRLLTSLRIKYARRIKRLRRVRKVSSASQY
jgi:hypothetical protein